MERGEIPKKERKKLKKRFNGFYAKESYALFLYRSIESLKEGGKLVFIIPDTYLNLNRHKEIRKFILTKTKINEIALFPSSYFPGINFGYANLSIIALEKCSNKTKCSKNSFKLIKGYKSVEELGKENIQHLTKLNIKQSSILNNEGFVFLTNSNTLITDCIKKSQVKIGDICDCATGFYSLIENRLFDQSIVGIFPKDIKLLDYLLAFFNSPTCNKLIRTINPSTNNSSNYIKKIPFLRPTPGDIKTITENSKQIVQQVKSSMTYDLHLEEENNQLINDLYGF